MRILIRDRHAEQVEIWGVSTGDYIIREGAVGKKCISFNMVLLVSSQNPVKKWSWQMAHTLEVSKKENVTQMKSNLLTICIFIRILECQNVDLLGLNVDLYFEFW